MLKGTGVYVNEHLTRKNADVARDACTRRKQNKIQTTWTRNGNVMIRLNGTPEEAKVVTIRDLKELEKYRLGQTDLLKLMDSVIMDIRVHCKKTFLPFHLSFLFLSEQPLGCYSNFPFYFRLHFCSDYCNSSR